MHDAHACSCVVLCVQAVRFFIRAEFDMLSYCGV